MGKNSTPTSKFYFDRLLELHYVTRSPGHLFSEMYMYDTSACISFPMDDELSFELFELPVDPCFFGLPGVSHFFEPQWHLQEETYRWKLSLCALLVSEVSVQIC